MPIVTLTTDWGTADSYIAQLKGAIYQACKDVTIVDITHQVNPFNSIQAAFVLRNSYSTFPPGTIHILGVNSEPSPRNKLIALEAGEHFFVGVNDGIFSLITDDEPTAIIELPEVKTMSGFRALPLFAYAAQLLSSGKSISSLGNPCELVRNMRTNANYDEKAISGIVVYTDNFGNAISNITRDLFETVSKGRPYEITIQSNHNLIRKISDYYDDVEVGELLAIFNSYDLLEIAMNHDNFAQLMNIQAHAGIRVKFFDDRLF